MPRGNRTGPEGQGPGTGGAMGFCAGYDTPGYMKGSGRGMGWGFGFGGGMGRGRVWGFRGGRHFGRHDTGYAPHRPWFHSMSREDEISMLKAEAESLKGALQDIEKRLNELGSQNT